jgi:hypothetical protein
MRKIKKTGIRAVEHKDGMIRFHEAHYDYADRVVAVSDTAVTPAGMGVLGAKAELALFALALSKPILKYTVFERGLMVVRHGREVR